MSTAESCVGIVAQGGLVLFRDVWVGLEVVCTADVVFHVAGIELIAAPPVGFLCSVPFE